MLNFMNQQNTENLLACKIHIQIVIHTVLPDKTDIPGEVSKVQEFGVL